MEKIRLGQVGIGHNHGEGKMLAARKQPDRFEIVGIAESDARWLESRGGMEAYRDLPVLAEEELLARCDAVLVECDVWNLTKNAQRCIDAGKHVHMDKPASGTLAEYETMLSAAQAKGLTVQLGYMYRYNPAIRRAIAMAKSGELGEIYEIAAEMSTCHSDDYRRWLQHFPGGTMYIFGCHLIDLIVDILGTPEKVSSFIRPTGRGGVISDDNTHAVLEYPHAIARVTNVSTEVNGWGRRQFTICGSKGTVQIMPIEVPVRMYYSGEEGVKRAYSEERTPLEVADVPQNCRYDEMMTEFYRVIRGEMENPYSMQHELTLQRVLHQACGLAAK